MREVAVTDGDKVEAQRRLGFSVNGYGVGDLAAMVDDATDAEVAGLIATYLDEYEVAPELRPGGARADSLRDGARMSRAGAQLKDADAAEAAWWFGAMTRRDGRRAIRALRILTEATK